MGVFSPSLSEIAIIGVAYHGWKDLKGLGPDYFAPKAVEQELFEFLSTGKTVTDDAKLSLAQGRARMLNFYNILNATQPVTSKLPCDFLKEVDTFLDQLKVQATIWRDKGFKSLGFSELAKVIYFRVVAKSAPALFYMGFADAIPHSGQVSRLTAKVADDLWVSMADSLGTAKADSLGTRHASMLHGAIVGWLHDPKYHPSIDLEKQNLATHPVNAAALAYSIFQDPELKEDLNNYFQRYKTMAADFIAGLIDALGINDDSRFVAMMVISPTLMKRVTNLYDTELSDEFNAFIEGRLESASKGIDPPELPYHLHAALSQIKLDSGLRGISQHGWRKALGKVGIETEDPAALFDQLIDGETTSLSAEQLTQLKAAILGVENAVLRADIKAAVLLHHHQEVCIFGRRSAEALVIADPMMLSPHKVASVYKGAISMRVASYIKSFDDNIRLLPWGARAMGLRWQRAVYLSMLAAAERLTSRMLIDDFKQGHALSSVHQDIDDLRTLLLNPEIWGSFAQASDEPEPTPEAKQAVKMLEECYVNVVDQYRNTIYQDLGEESLNKFYPTR